MNWSKAKNWLILLFLFLNVFLIVKLVSLSTSSSTIDKKIIRDTVSVLNANNIFVSESQIPNKIPKLNSVEVTNSISDKNEFAKLLLGDGFQKEDDSFKSGNKLLKFSKNQFFYTNSEPCENFSLITPENAERLVADFLERLNISTDSAISSVEEAGGKYVVSFHQKLDKYPLFDSFITAVANKSGILSINGSWFLASVNQSAVTTDASRIVPSTSALVDFISEPSRIKNKPVEIIEISLGYSSGNDREYHTNAVAIPVWQIKTSDNKLYYFDAR